jgi:choline monooxygenase
MDTLLAPTLPSSCYTETSHFQLEKEKLFFPTWLYLAHQKQIPHTLDYITLNLLGELPLVLYRDEAGDIKSFYNICRHRGAKLLTKTEGNLGQDGFKCSYHGWNYSSHNGQVKAIPFCDIKKLPSEKLAALNLIPFSLKVIDGFIFGKKSKTDPEEKPYLEFFSELQKINYPWQDFTHFKTISVLGDFNWKTWVDGFQECYHCHTVHPCLKKDFGLQDYLIENFSNFSAHSCLRRTTSESGTFDGKWFWLFPNLGLPLYEKVFYSLQVNPIAAEKTQLIYNFFGRNDASLREKSRFIEFVELLTQEDVNICLQVQQNIRSEVYQHGHLVLDREHGVQHFHQMVSQAVQV